MKALNWTETIHAFGDQYDALDKLLTSLNDDDLLQPSACRGWSNSDLVFHLVLDAQRALVTFISPSPGPADTDYVGYWQGFSAADEDSSDHARFVRICAAAHSEPSVIVHRLCSTAAAAVRCGRKSSDIEFVTTQGHILRTSDFIATLVVEAVVHHLDLVANLGDRRAPVASALSLTERTVEGLLGRPRPHSWDPTTFILKTTGRDPLTEDDQRLLGMGQHQLPVFS